jgi:hypothetical protein
VTVRSTTGDGLPGRKPVHPIPDALAPGVCEHLDRHGRDVALLRSVVLPFLEPTVPPTAPCHCGSPSSDDGAH